MSHHLIGDHTTLEVQQEEIRAHLLGQEHQAAMRSRVPP
jgi:hypothetical protein